MTQPLPDALAQLVAQRWDKLTPRSDWTWGEWFAYIERLQREFEALYPPSECVMFPEEGA